jgi:hypothetical protein
MGGRKEDIVIRTPQVPDGYETYNYIETPQASLIAVLIELHGDICWYCDKPYTDIPDDKWSRTVDHFHSKDWCKKQGYDFYQTHGMTNLVMAHKGCNSTKSNREWLEDGTLAPRGRVRKPKGPRPELCDTCMSGRLLLMGEFCPDCGSGPQPATAPKAYQVTPKECDHDGDFYCWMCFIGHVPRKTALNLGGAS